MFYISLDQHLLKNWYWTPIDALSLTNNKTKNTKKSANILYGVPVSMCNNIFITHPLSMDSKALIYVFLQVQFQKQKKFWGALDLEEERSHILLSVDSVLSHWWKTLKPYVGVVLHEDLLAMIAQLLMVSLITIIQIRWKFHFVCIQIIMVWLIQNFAHAMTAVCKILYWHYSLELTYSKKKIPMNWESEHWAQIGFDGEQAKKNQICWNSV